QHQDPSKDILAGNARGQGEHVAEELFLGLGPAGNRGWPAGACQHSHQGDNDHAHQRVLPIDRGTGVVQVVEMGDDVVQAKVVNLLNVVHDSFSVNPLTGYDSAK